MNTDYIILKEYGITEPVNKVPGKTKVSLLLGRFQPFHLGHKSLLEEMSHPAVIAVIRGKKSSQDKERNPFSFATQRKAIMAVAPEILAVDEFQSADVAYIIDKFRDYDLEVVELWCGSDRVAGYKAQVDKYAPKINANVAVKALTRNADADDVSSISATQLRQALRDNDAKLVNKYMGKIPDSLLKLLHSEIISK